MNARTILVLNGPNLNLLGFREPAIYGSDTLEALEGEVRRYAEKWGAAVSCRQSNSEGDLIDIIQAAPGTYDAIVYNPGAHTHYSYALRDAVAAIDVPVVEVHLSDIDNREPFRAVSVIAPVCRAQVKGLGIEGYCRAIDIVCADCDYERLGEGYARMAQGENVVIGLAVESESEEISRSAPSSSRLDSLVLFQAEQAPMACGAPADEAAHDASGPLEPFLPLEASGAPVAPGAQGVPSNGVTTPFPEIVPIDAGLLSSRRQALVREECARLGIGALLVRDTSNVQWLTALDGVFDEERAHALLVAGGRTVLHTDSRYANAMRTGIARIGSAIEVDDAKVGHAQFAFDALFQDERVACAEKLGIEDSITYAEFVRMVDRFTADALAPTTDVVLKLRSVKDAGEIARMKAAQAITDAAFAHIIGFMKPGMTEREVQLELEDFMVRHDSEGLAFRSIVATGANGADPHAVPGGTRLEAGQCVVMDFGAKAHGYCSDMTRTVFLGAPEGDMARAWETLRCANETVEDALKPGMTGADAHQLAERVLEEGGFGGCMGHGLGHGVGIDVHELPSLNPRNNGPLAEGNVVTVEPGIYLPGRFGMRLEDFGVITAVGFEVFTNSTHEMVVV